MRSLLVVMALVAASLGALGPVAAAAADPLLTASVSGSPFRGSGTRPRVTLRVRIDQPASITVQALAFGGTVLRTLVRDQPHDAGTFSVAWDGRDRDGRLVPDGPYRLRVIATGGSSTERAERWVTKAPGVPWVPATGGVVVAINPGHGGSDPGAIVAGVHEADINLDIALRLRRMLQAAGVTVVMTRSSDRDVNRPAVDRNRDGRIDHKDELIARNDVADLARADLTLNVHNNATACGCGDGTEMFVNPHRPWAAASRALAQAVQRAHLRRLRAFEDRTWHVVDRGIGSGTYVSLQGYQRRYPRPSLMPAILGESLYLDRRAERRRLSSPGVRTAIAASYYDGVVAWLAQRQLAVRWTDASAPREVAPGGKATVGVRLTATGHLPLSGWHIEARVVHAVPVIDGTGAIGRLVGSVALGGPLAPGDSRDLTFTVTMPPEARHWLLKLDLVRGSTRLAARGIVQPQLRVTTGAP
jgi:N-acetylmuramoyl-L-alanine amidase